MIAGSLTMPRKAKPSRIPEPDSPSEDAGGTQQIRVFADLADKLAIITKKRKTTSAKLLDPVIRPFITQLFADVRKEMEAM